MDAEKEVTEQSKKMAKMILGILWKIVIKPLMPYIIIAFLIFMLISMLIAAVYSAMPQLGALAGITQVNEEDDKKAQEEYQKLCDKYNVFSTLLVNDSPCEPDGNSYESSTTNKYYPGNGVSKLGVLADPYGSDKALILKWGQIHAAALYRAYNFGQNKITHQEKVAKDLHPYFYYKKSYKYTKSKDESDKDIRYLLVEAYTIKGHYQYHYEWVTKTYGEGDNKVTVTKEELKDTQQILQNKWQRLDDWVVDEYELEKNDEVPLTRTAVWEAGNAFDKHAEWLKWLIYNVSSEDYISCAMIPPELISYFQEAEEKYGIPWWFIAAVAFKESTFNPQAENSSSHCYGLMQILPSNWSHYAPKLGFDEILDKDNPRAQIMVGTYLLKNYLGDVDWDGDWKEGTLYGLTFYGGFSTNGVIDDAAKERCRREYASKIWDYAEGFKNGSASWPVPGYTYISSPFGYRIHPILGYKKFHEGIDIPAPTGTTVVSVSAGVVKTAGWVSGYGNTIEVEDAQHKYLYGHLSAIDVSVKQTVQSGQEIGKVGSTGDSTGPHLHFGVWDLSINDWIDPLLVLQK